MEKINNPIFIGTKEDFIKFIGGYCRNKVLSLSKPHKKKFKTCENGSCKNRTNLEAAHIHGRDRITIINNILERYINGKEQVEINLNEFEDKFIEEHTPIKDTIKIYCKKCHREYDKNTNTENKVDEEFIDTDDVELIKKLDKKNKIGYTIRAYFKSLEPKQISHSLIRNLCDADYSKDALNLAYPVLLEVTNHPSVIDSTKNRYYIHPYTLNNKPYYLCNHWFDYHIDKFNEWAQSIQDSIH